MKRQTAPAATIMHFTLLLLISLVLHGCAILGPMEEPGTPRPQPSTPRPQPGEPAPQPGAPVPQQTPPAMQTGPARSLYAQANEALAAGHPGQAEMLLERALRIEPGNAQFWHALGQSKYDQGEFAQAVQFCLKSESLARDNGGLGQRNRVLLGKAYRKLGDVENAEKFGQ